MSAREPLRYRFGPVDPRGLVGAVRASQCLVVVSGVALTLGAMQAVPLAGAPLAFVPLALCCGIAFVPVRGMLLLDLGRLGLAYVLDRLSGRASWRARSSGAGIPAGPDEETGSLDLPRQWGAFRIVAVPQGGRSVGMLLDERAGTASATLLVRTEAFALLSERDQERRVRSWGQLLAGLAREGRPVRRLAWTERTVQAEADEIGDYFARNRDRQLELDADSVLSYVELIDGSTRAALEHECFVSVEVAVGARRREIRQLQPGAGSRDLAIGRVVLDELRLVAHALEDAGVGRVGALPPRLLAAAIRHGVDPGARAHLARLAAAGAEEGCAPSGAGPLGIEERWDHVRLDSAFAATFWVARWPLRDVGSLFLAPLVSRTQALRSVTVVCEPVPPSRAQRRAESALTRDESDRKTREKHGFLQTARHRRRRDDLEDQERELADGHALCRFSGYVTVQARTLDELEVGCAEVAQAAQHSQLELRRLVGEQANALAFTLPGLCRGLD